MGADISGWKHTDGGRILVVDWEATGEEEMRVQAVVLLLPAVDPAGGRSSSSSAGGGGRAMEMLLQLVAPKSQSP